MDKNEIKKNHFTDYVVVHNHDDLWRGNFVYCYSWESCLLDKLETIDQFYEKSSQSLCLLNQGDTGCDRDHSVFLFGTLYTVVPFSSFLDFGEEMKESWVEKSEEPPYGHAEESTLKDFSQKTGNGLEQLLKVLKENGIDASQTDTLGSIATAQRKTPGEIFSLTTATLGVKTPKDTGLGRKSISDVAKALDMDSDQFLKELK